MENILLCSFSNKVVVILGICFWNFVTAHCVNVVFMVFRNLSKFSHKHVHNCCVCVREKAKKKFANNMAKPYCWNMIECNWRNASWYCVHGQIGFLERSFQFSICQLHALTNFRRKKKLLTDTHTHTHWNCFCFLFYFFIFLCWNLFARHFCFPLLVQHFVSLSLFVCIFKLVHYNNLLIVFLLLFLLIQLYCNLYACVCVYCVCVIYIRECCVAVFVIHTSFRWDTMKDKNICLLHCTALL